MALDALEGGRSLMMGRILLVEDNPITRKVISTALVDGGYRILEAGDAATASRLLEQQGVDLVLLDLVLPDADGLELAAQLRSGPLAHSPEIPLLALTEEQDDVRAVGAGFTDIVSKPVEPARVLSAVRIHLSRSSADPPGDGARLLLVDANPRALRLSARRFEQLGFQVVTASSVDDAMQKLEEIDPNVVVSELLSDEVNGFELCQSILGRPERASVPVILVSPHQLTPVEREFAARIGVAATVLRTSDLNLLVDAVFDVLRPRSRHSVPPPSIPVSQDHRRHAISTIEHRANLKEDIARRDGTLRAVRSVLECVNELGGRSRADVLQGILGAILDATGYSFGVGYLSTPDGSLELHARIGFGPQDDAALRTFWDHLPLLVGVTEMGEPRGACLNHSGGSIQQVLTAAGMGSLILVPLVHGSRRLGVLALGSRSARLPADWLVLSETLSGSLANAVALANVATQLQETEKRFHGIADSTTEGIVVCDADGRIEYANAALLRIVDLPTTEVSGRLLEEVLPFMGSSSESGQGTLTRGDGQTVPVEATARTVEDPFGRPCRLYVVRDLSERLRLSQVAWLATHDALTGLYNRHRFEEDLALRLSESRRYGTSCAVLLIDIDHFKLINDTYGHQAGDSVLGAIADVLKKNTRESDVPARLGGDEFIVLLPQSGLDQARACATNIFDRVRQLNPTYQGWSLPVSISIGVAAYPQHGDLPETLVTSADEALYRAKRAGRNRICVGDSIAYGSLTRIAAAPRLPSDLTVEPADEDLAQNV